MTMIFSPCSFSALSCSILVPCLSQSPGISPDVFLLSLLSLFPPHLLFPPSSCVKPQGPHTGGVPAVPGRAVRESPPAAPIHSVTNNQERKGHGERPSFGDGRGHAAGCGTLPLLHFPAPSRLETCPPRQLQLGLPPRATRCHPRPLLSPVPGTDGTGAGSSLPILETPQMLCLPLQPPLPRGASHMGG